MDALRTMQTFVKVVEAGSFAKAAGRLGMSAAMATKHLNHLETRLGARLLQRTTRQLSLTEAGQAYFERCREILADISEAEALAGSETQVPQGTVRVASVNDFGSRELTAAILDFQTDHPQVRFEVMLGSRIVDLVEESIDVAVRVQSKLEPSELVARKLATANLVACASPGYLERHGVPRIPDELAGRNCFSPFGTEWPFSQAGNTRLVKVTGSLSSDSSPLMLRAAHAGAGIAVLQTYTVAESLQSGRLVRLLGNYTIAAMGIYAVYPHRRYLSAKVRAFVDFLVQRFGPDPDADPWLWEAEACTTSESLGLEETAR